MQLIPCVLSGGDPKQHQSRNWVSKTEVGVRSMTTSIQTTGSRTRFAWSRGSNALKETIVPMYGIVGKL